MIVVVLETGRRNSTGSGGGIVTVDIVVEKIGSCVENMVERVSVGRT